MATPAVPPPAASATPLTVGQSVLVHSKHRAVIRFLGATDFAEGEWVGLELEKPIGKHEGTVLGRTYFSTPKKHGTFVRADALVPL
jgi:dynactin complex subunit